MNDKKIDTPIKKPQPSLLEDFQLFYEAVPPPTYLEKSGKVKAESNPYRTKRIARKKR